MYKYHKTYHKSSHICECENRSLLLKGRRRGQKSVLTELDWAERVSVLLGHQSVRITEKHYAPWVRSRQEQLEADLARAWSRDPLVLSQGEVHTRGTLEGMTLKLLQFQQETLVPGVGVALTECE